jgi:hypothetical protein
MYTCEIDCEYFPENIITMQDKIEYLGLTYSLTNTSNSFAKIITATINNFSIYDTTIFNGEYRIVVHTLTNNNITSTNQNGFVQDCEFNVTSATINNQTATLLKQKNMQYLQSYDIDYSYMHNDIATITIPLDRAPMLHNLEVYMLKDGRLTKLNSYHSADGLSFITSEQNATYIIAKPNYSGGSNSYIAPMVMIICVYVCLYAVAIIRAVKKNKWF